MVEVWRPGGRSDERRPRHDRNRHRHQDLRSSPATAPAPAAAAGEAGEGAKHERHRRGRRERHKISASPAPSAGRGRAARGGRAGGQRDARAISRPPRERFEGRDRDKDRDNGGHKGKFGGGRDKGGARQGWPRQGGRDSATAALAPAICDQREPARTRAPGRSQFAVRQTGGAEGTAHRQPQGSLANPIR